MAALTLSRRHFLHSSLLGAGLLGLPGLAGCLTPEPESIASEAAAAFALLRGPTEGTLVPALAFTGPMGERLRANHRRWLLLFARQNSDMTAMLRAGANIQPIVPWSGEFSGKYLVAAAQAFVLDRDVELLRAGNQVVDGLRAQHSVVQRRETVGELRQHLQRPRAIAEAA